MDKVKNHGFNPAMQYLAKDGTEYKFGASSPTCLFAVDETLRDQYLPAGERQRGREDFQDCVTRAYINILETKFTYAYRQGLLIDENRDWLLENGYVTDDGRVEFSDRFNAMLSNTTRQGNSLKAPAHSIYKNGLIPKKMLPASKSMDWDDYHDKRDITDKMIDLGEDFLQRFRINYEEVPANELDTLLIKDMANIAVFAWSNPINGEYPRTDNPFTHAVMAFGLPKTSIFDNYEETESDPRAWVKKLAEDYNIYRDAYRIYISQQTTPEEKKMILRVFVQLVLKGQLSLAWKVIKEWLAKDTKKKDL